MPQVQFPIFPVGSVEINRDLACRSEGDQVIYYNGHLPVFTHAKNDLASFRLCTSQLIIQGSATQGHIAKAFGVPLVAIKRGPNSIDTEVRPDSLCPKRGAKAPNSIQRS